MENESALLEHLSKLNAEAIVPKTYVQNNWTQGFDLVDWVDTFSVVASQPIIVLKRK